MNQDLSNILTQKVFEDSAIRELSSNGGGPPTNWIFNFKHVALSKHFMELYARAFWEQFKILATQTPVAIGGMESGAIPLIAGISLHEPKEVTASYFYIRKSRKKSDLANQIEGDLSPSMPIILVDDILNTGTTILKQINILHEQGHSVKAIFTCLRYRDIEQYKSITEQGIEIYSMGDLNDLSSVLPVANLTTPKQTLGHINPYRIAYKLTLTKKPNRYLVLPKSSPILAGNLLYIGTDDGAFYCINTDSGDVVWTYKVLFGAKGKMIFSSPNIHDDKVIFGAYDGNLYCLDRYTGKRHWVFMDADWIGSSPEIAHGVCYIGLEFGLNGKQGGIAAIKIETGEVLWKYYDIPSFVHGSPLFVPNQNLVACGSNDGTLYALDSASGKLKWKLSTSGAIKYRPALDQSGNKIIFGNMEGELHVINATDGSLLHTHRALAGIYSTPLIVGDTAYIGSLDKHVYAIDIESGTLVWKQETGGRIFSSPALYREHIFIGSNDGILYELNPKNGEVLSRTLLTERVVNQVVGKDGDQFELYVPTHACEIYKLVQQ